MFSVAAQGAIAAPTPIHVENLRARAILRRASVTPSVARVLAELAFQLDRDHATAIPLLMTETSR